MKQKNPQISRAEARDALLRSGYLLESRIESVLRANNFYVEANSLIPDDITGKMREIDLCAGSGMGYSFGPNDQGDISLELVIECVNPPQPVAFITKERGDPLLQRTRIWDALKLVGNPQEINTSPHNAWDWLSSKLGLDRFHHYRAQRVSTQYCSFSRKSGSVEWMAHHREEDHQAIRKLCAATDHFIRDLVVPNYSRAAGWSLTLVYPVLIIQAGIFEVRPGKRSARIVSSNHVQFRTRQTVRDEQQEYQIDVITERFFPQFLTIVQREMRLMSNKLQKRYAELLVFRSERQRNLEQYYSGSGQLKLEKD
jgi:hypothetical protein